MLSLYRTFSKWRAPRDVYRDYKGLIGVPTRDSVAEYLEKLPCECKVKDREFWDV